MKFFVKTKLSDNISKTPEGFLLCRNVPLTHTGQLEYFGEEHPFYEHFDKIIMRRLPEDLFSLQTMASFEGKDFTIKHPEEFINPDNYKELTCGVLFNIRRGSKTVEIAGEHCDVLLGDILIKNRDAIELVQEGEREVSLGYDAEWELLDENEGIHSGIIGNHCALVSEGRAGNNCKINDHKKENNIMDTKILKKFKKLFGKSVDEAMKEKEEEKKVADELEEEEKKKAADMEEEKKKKAADMEEEKKKKAADEEEKKKAADSDLKERLSKVEMMLSKIMEKFSESEDEESEDEDDEDESKLVVADEEEESEDEYDEEKEVSDMEGMEGEDEDSDEEKKKASDSLSRAEILSPGIKKSKNMMSKALSNAYKTKDGKKVIDNLTGGRKLSKLKKFEIRPIFVSASELLKTKRVNDFASQKAMTIDNFPSLKVNKNLSADEINKKNAEFYGNK